MFAVLCGANTVHNLCTLWWLARANGSVFKCLGFAHCAQGALELNCSRKSVDGSFIPDLVSRDPSAWCVLGNGGCRDGQAR